MKKLLNSAIAVALLISTASAQQTQTNTSASGNTNTTSGSTTNNTTSGTTNNSNRTTTNSSGTNQNTNNTTDASANANANAMDGTNNNQYDYTVSQYYDRMESDRMGTYNLTPQQRTQLSALNSDYERNMRSLNENTSMSAQDRMDKYNTYRSQRRNSYMGLLSDADRQSYQTYMNEWDYNRYNWTSRQKELSLTDDQVSKLNNINVRFTQREAQIITNNSLADNDRNSQLKVLRAERANLFNSVLSADQITKLDVDRNNVKIKTKTGNKTKKVKTKTKTARM